MHQPDSEHAISVVVDGEEVRGTVRHGGSTELHVRLDHPVVVPALPGRAGLPLLGPSAPGKLEPGGLLEMGPAELAIADAVAAASGVGKHVGEGN